MKIPFVDVKKQYFSIKKEIDLAVLKVLESGNYIMGKEVSAFEKQFASYHNVKYCSGVSSGTDAVHLALWSLGIKSGDEVIIPANTFIATAWGATLCGAKPVFVDCESDSYNIDAEKIQSAITKRTKAIIAVHLYGQPANLSAIKKVCKENSLFLIEDAAQAHLAEYKNKKVGTFGDISLFSFYPGKNLGAYGEAGAVITNNKNLDAKVKLLRNHGSERKYYHKTLGHNYRMEEIQAAVLNVKMKYIKRLTEKRRTIAKIFNSEFNGIGDLFLPKEKPYAKHVYHLYVIQSSARNELAAFLNRRDIQTGLHYPLPLHLQECFKHLGYKKGNFKVTESLADCCLSLPIYPEMTESQIDFLITQIRKFYN